MILDLPDNGLVNIRFVVVYVFIFMYTFLYIWSISWISAPANLQSRVSGPSECHLNLDPATHSEPVEMH